MSGAAKQPIRVVVVDDQAFMRIALRRMIEADGDISVVGEARDGEEALAEAQRLKPDVMTMDVVMPVLSGIEACGRIMREVSPPPAIIMVSALTQQGAADTIEAMRQGAVDFISKSTAFATTDLARLDAELRPRLRIWSRRPPALQGLAREQSPEPAREPPPGPRLAGGVDLVLVAASTGGPQALTRLLQAMGPIQPPIVIAQHMPPMFTRSLAGLLSGDTGLAITEASHGQLLAPGQVWLLPGGSHGLIQRGSAGLRISLTAATGPDNDISPSADRLFRSAATAGASTVAVVLTGMGQDGAAGAAELHRRAMPVLVQDPAECVVAGMPEAVIKAGCAIGVLPLIGIAAWLRRNTG
jgi:two-component system chemotaxis response regulator CheB